MNMQKNKKVFSGIKPSGDMTLGNYLGMLAPAMADQKGKENIFCVVNYHAITVPQDPETLAKRTIDVAKFYLASGLDLNTSLLFVQADVPEHAELGSILNCFTYFGEASRMTQFKDKHREKGENVTVGLFDYPILMAADILIYDADEVPVGDDQKQHVELTRDIAERFNKKFGETFVVPTPVIKAEGARIMSLTNPERKMSKSDDDPNGYIMLLDTPAEIKKKVMKATTDSDNVVKYDPKNKPGISNLLNILSVAESRKISEIEKRYVGKNYGDFKADVAEAIVKMLTPFQEKFHSYRDEEIRNILSDGAKRVRPLAKKKLLEVKTKIGLNY